MKKTRGKKKKISHKKRNRFSFNNQLVVISIVAIFLLCMILLAFVNKPTGQVITGQQTGWTEGKGFIENLFAQWTSGHLDVNIAKYLFFFMLAGLIWGALNFAKFPKNGFFQLLIALSVAFLSTAYITPDEVFTILSSYTALGITLTFLVPFIIMLFVSGMLLSTERIRDISMPKIMLEVFLWVFFLIILGYKIIAGMVRGDISLELNIPILIMVGVFFVSFLILIFNKAFRNFMWKIAIEIRRWRARLARVEAEEAMETAKTMEKAKER